jgi:hypothetical protein
MRNRAQLFVILLAVIVIASGCRDKERVTDVYVNQKDHSQVLELTSNTKVFGGLTAAYGRYLLRSDQNTASGNFRKVEGSDHPNGTEDHAYVLSLGDNKQMKLWVVSGASELRDEAGGTWTRERRSFDWRVTASADTTEKHLKVIP